MFDIRTGMARPWRILYAGAKYHVTVRGNARQEVFHEEHDYLRFIEQLADALDKDEIILYAFVLMPNHYHLFVETKHGNIQRFMQRLDTSCSACITGINTRSQGTVFKAGTAPSW